MKAKFLRETISIERPVPKKNIQTDFNNVKFFELQGPEIITITIEFIGSGDTTNLKTEDLLHKIMNRIGEEL